jgi:NADP-dependent 3-hydroxy acid dehydrogenase YdfG
MGALEEHLAVVTGATGGIGRAVVAGLTAAGARVVAVGRNAAALRDLAAAAPAGSVTTVAADIATDEAVGSIAGAVRDHASGLDVLVHGAGIFAMGPVATADIADLDRQYRVNLRAPFLLTRELLPALRARRGQIVFVNSSAGVASRAGITQYAATKHALKALADGLRDEVNADGVRVASVYPGRTAGPLQQRIHVAEGKDYRPRRLMQPEDVAAVVLHALTAPRTVEITDVFTRPLRKP